MQWYEHREEKAPAGLGTPAIANLTPLLSAAEAGGEYNQVWRDGGPWQPSEVPGGTLVTVAIAQPSESVL